MKTDDDRHAEIRTGLIRGLAQGIRGAQPNRGATGSFDSVQSPGFEKSSGAAQIIHGSDRSMAMSGQGEYYDSILQVRTHLTSRLPGKFRCPRSLVAAQRSCGSA